MPAAAQTQILPGADRRPPGAGHLGKDIILALIARTGVEGGTGYVYEYSVKRCAPWTWSSA